MCVNVRTAPAINPAARQSLKRSCYVAPPLLLPLLPAGNEGSVDKLLKQIGGFMSDIAGVCSSRLRAHSSAQHRFFMCVYVQPASFVWMCGPADFAAAPLPLALASFWALGRYPPRRLSCAASLAAQPASCVDRLLPVLLLPPLRPPQQTTSRWSWLRPSARCASSSRPSTAAS